MPDVLEASRDVFNRSYVVVATWIVMFVLQFLVISFIVKLRYFWQYGKRLQEHCGNSAMEMETTRYNVYRFVGNDKMVRDHKIAVISMFILVMILSAVPLLWMAFNASAMLLNRIVFFFGKPPVIPPVDIGSGIITTGVCAVFCIVSFAMFMKTTGKVKQNKLYNRWFGSGYAQNLDSVRTDILKHLFDCDPLPRSERKARNDKGLRCSATQLYRNLIESILITDQMQSPDAARQRLDMLIGKDGAEVLKDSKNEGVIKYVRFNSYAPDWEHLIRAEDAETSSSVNTASTKRSEKIRNLESFEYADPSSDMIQLMKRWMNYIFVMLSILLYFVFHHAYHHMDRLTLIGVCILLGGLAGILGFAKRYQM